MRASSETIGATSEPTVGVADEVAQQAGEGHGGRHRLGARPGGELLEDLGVGRVARASGRTTRTGSGPASTRPRARRYSMASEPSAGRM